MIRSIILCALILGVANAARQIVVNPSPPPPGPTTDNVPGAIWSVVVPGYSPATFGSSQSTTLCQAMVNRTSSYPKEYIKCQVNSVVQTAGYNSVAAQGQMYWSDFTGSTPADKTARTTSRDLFVNTIGQNPGNLAPSSFPGANINDTCASNWVPPTTGSAISAAYTINGMPLAQCRMAVKGTTSETTTGCTTAGTEAELCLTNIGASTVGAYGMDNGKVCPLGSSFIYPQTQQAATSLFTGVAADSAVSVGLTQVSGLVYDVKLTFNTASTGISVGDIQDTRTLLKLSGVTTGGITGGTGCDAAQVVDTLAKPQVVQASALSSVGITGGSYITLRVDWASAGCTTVPTFPSAFNGANSGALIKVQNSWSPACDSSNAFYTAYQYDTAAAGRKLGNVCPRCGTSSNAVPFKYNGSNAKSLCSAVSTSQGVYNAGGPLTTEAAGFAGQSCIKIGVANLGASDPNTGRPMLSTQVPYFGTGSQYTYSFPDTTDVSGQFSSSATPIVQYQAGNEGTTTNTKFQLMAYDSEWMMPCSTPQLVPSSSSTNVTGSQGVYLQGTDAATKGAGSCNTVSKFWNGGKGTTNGIDSYTSSMADLPTVFTAPIVGPTPAPTPTPPPASPPSPKPTPPAVPPSPPSLICTYKGSYEITPLYGPCNKYYLASGTTSDCSNNYVNLRTKSQLGNKMARIRWAVATVAEKGLSTPTNVVAEARLSAKGSCTNRNLAAPSDPSEGLKVGGSSWKWQIVPYPGSDKCDEVNLISQNRLTTTAFLEVPKSCNTFRYNATDGGRQRFKMIKV